MNNRVSTILSTVFNEKSLLDLRYEEVTDLADIYNGAFEPDLSQTGTANGISYTILMIHINGNTLPNAAKEYATVTYLHEAIHAYLSLTNKTNLLDHEDIALQYRGAIADIVKNMYGISQANADALAWQGLFETSVWDTYQSSHPNLSNQIGNINTNYHNGTQGTHCN